MGKFKDRILGVLLFFISIILWLYTLLVSANIPMGISRNEVKISVVSLILFGFVYSIYIIKVKNRSEVSLLLLTFICFLTDILTNLEYSVVLRKEINKLIPKKNLGIGKLILLLVRNPRKIVLFLQ